MGGKYFLIILLILAACEPYTQTTPTQSLGEPAQEITTNPCATIQCSNDKICQNGQCTCPTNKKQCGDTCIQENECCTNTDCQNGSCQDGECVTETCAYGEIFKNGECKCAPDKTYCSEQKKCISRNSCCIHTQCPTFHRCVQTSYSTSLCITIGPKKFCRTIADNGRVEIFNVLNESFRIAAENWNNDETVEAVINDEEFIVTNKTTNYGTNATIFHEGINTIGGYCKEDED